MSAKQLTTTQSYRGWARRCQAELKRAAPERWVEYVGAARTAQSVNIVWQAALSLERAAPLKWRRYERMLLRTAPDYWRAIQIHRMLDIVRGNEMLAEELLMYVAPLESDMFDWAAHEARRALGDGHDAEAYLKVSDARRTFFAPPAGRALDDGHDTEAYLEASDARAACKRLLKRAAPDEWMVFRAMERAADACWVYAKQLEERALTAARRWYESDAAD